jgi:hypothetical protein
MTLIIIIIIIISQPYLLIASRGDIYYNFSYYIAPLFHLLWKGMWE